MIITCEGGGRGDLHELVRPSPGFGKFCFLPVYMDAYLRLLGDLLCPKVFRVAITLGADEARPYACSKPFTCTLCMC